MSQIHLIGGEKGGVGKSTVARLLAQEFIDRNLPFLALDGDQSHADLLRFYGDYSQPLNLRDNQSADAILLSAIEADRQVLVDLPAQSAGVLETWIAETDVLELTQELNIDLVVWHVLDGSRNSVDLLERSLNDFAEDSGVTFIIVKNHGRGSQFDSFDKSETKAKAIQRGAKIIDLSALDENVMSRIDWLGMSFWAAANLTQGESLSLLERRRVAAWRKNWQEQLQPLVDLIFPRKKAEVVQLYNASNESQDSLNEDSSNQECYAAK